MCLRCNDRIVQKVRGGHFIRKFQEGTGGLRANALSDPPGSCTFFSLNALELSSGIVRRRCQLHGEIKEAFRLSVEKSVGRKGRDGGHGTP